MNKKLSAYLIFFLKKTLLSKENKMNIPSKVNDMTIGTCKICGGTHIGRIITGSDYAKIDYMGIAKVGDLVQSDCNHLGTINKGSDYNFMDGTAVAYPGDTFEGDYSGQILKE